MNTKEISLLNRRFLRVKVFQALYGYFQAPEPDYLKAEKELFKSVDKIADLYFYLLLLSVELLDVARNQMELKKQKLRPTAEDLNPNLRFVENKVLLMIENNHEFKTYIETKKIRWTDQGENIRKMWKIIQESEAYTEYMNHPNHNGFEADKAFVYMLFTDFILDYELTASYLEELNVHWVTDMEIAGFAVLKAINHLQPTDSPLTAIKPPMYKDEEEDLRFTKELFRKTIMFSADYQSIVAEKTENWEVERLAVIDVLLMKMCMTEFEHFSSIPPKVSMNEYIELAKAFSTEKSKVFINGLLDKILLEMKKIKRIHKAGRGLIES